MLEARKMHCKAFHSPAMTGHPGRRFMVFREKVSNMVDWSGAAVGAALAIFGLLLIIFSRWFAAGMRHRPFRRWYRRTAHQAGYPPVLPATTQPTWSLQRVTTIIAGVIFLVAGLFDLVRSCR